MTIGFCPQYFIVESYFHSQVHHPLKDLEYLIGLGSILDIGIVKESRSWG